MPINPNPSFLMQIVPSPSCKLQSPSLLVRQESQTLPHIMLLQSPIYLCTTRDIFKLTSLHITPSISASSHTMWVKVCKVPLFFSSFSCSHIWVKLLKPIFHIYIMGCHVNMGTKVYIYQVQVKVLWYRIFIVVNKLFNFFKILIHWFNGKIVKYVTLTIHIKIKQLIIIVLLWP